MQKWIRNLPIISMTRENSDNFPKNDLGKIFWGVVITLVALLFLFGGGTWLWISIAKQRYRVANKGIINPSQEIAVEKDTLDIGIKLLQTAGVIGFFFTAYMSWKSLQNAEKNLKSNEDKIITERFGKAVELLSDSEKLEARIGGIYLLERIAWDSPEDQTTVMNVLTAFIRQQTLIKSFPINQPLIKSHISNNKDEDNSTVSADIQAALSVLGSRNINNDGKGKLNLSEARLNGADLRGANLTGADLSKAHLRGANLSGTNLSKADLSYTDLSEAIFSDTREHSSLRFGDSIPGMMEYSIDLNFDTSRSNFAFANLSNANLFRAKLSRTWLQGVDLSGAMLNNTDLTFAKLQNSKLIRASLKRANLKGANLTSTNLSGAKLWNADLENAVFYGANLAGAELNNTNLNGTKFS